MFPLQIGNPPKRQQNIWLFCAGEALMLPEEMSLLSEISSLTFNMLDRKVTLSHRATEPSNVLAWFVSHRSFGTTCQKEKQCFLLF